MTKKTVLLILFCAFLVAVRGQEIAIKTGYYTIDERYDAPLSGAVKTVIERYKPEVGQRTAKVIGESATAMEAKMPESLLTNFSTDVLLEKGSEVLGEAADLSILNIGGIRAAMPQDEVTLGALFEIYPFDNTVEILYLKGAYLKELFDFFAEKEMQPMANVVLKVRGNKIEEALIGGTPLDETKIYKVVTLNYLRKGGDGMGVLDNAEKVVNTRRQLRDMIGDYISDRYNRGEKIDATLDNRVITY